MKDIQVEKVNFISYEQFKMALGVEKIQWIKYPKRSKADLYGIDLFTAENLDWDKPTFVTEGAHGNLYVVNHKVTKETYEK